MSLRDSFRRGSGTATKAPEAGVAEPVSHASDSKSTAAGAPARAGSAAAGTPARPGSGAAPGAPTGRSHAIAASQQRLKAQVHRTMIERIDLASLDTITPEQLRIQVRQIIGMLIAEESIPFTDAQRLALEDEVLNETFGLGPIEPFLHDPDVADI